MKRNTILTFLLTFFSYVLFSQATTTTTSTTTAPASGGPLTLVYPNSGTFSQGQSVQISWRGGDTTKPIYLALISQIPFKTQQVITHQVNYNGGTYSNWVIPSTMPAGNYMVYVQSNRGASPSQWMYGGLITITPSCAFNGQPRLIMTRDSSLMPLNRTVTVGSTNTEVDYVRFKVINNSQCDLVVTSITDLGGTIASQNSQLFLQNTLSKIYEQNGAVYSVHVFGQPSVGTQSFTLPAGTSKWFDCKITFPSSLSGISVSGTQFMGGIGGITARDANGNQLTSSDIQIVGVSIPGGIITLQ